MSDDPSKTLPAVDAMRKDWAIVDVLMGGTRAMREAGKKFLPQWPKEEADAYQARLNTSTLLPAYSETVQNMTGRVFSDPIAFCDDISKQIEEMAEDFDRQGNNLQVWAQSLFSTGLSHGLCHVLVDYPPAEGLKTKADEKSAGVRPYGVIIKPGQVLGWRSEPRGGQIFLTQFRYMESVEVDDGAFGCKNIDQIRVLVPGAWATYREVEDGKGKKVWMLYEEGATSLPVIPLATFYTKRTGFLTATPPLLELANMNVKHWQSQSDQDNILHVARVPMLAVSGIDDGSLITVGAGAATLLPKDCEMKWVEHTGKAIEAGRQSLQDLVEDMRLAGAKLLQRERQTIKTASQSEEEAAQEMSPLQTMAGQLEDALDQVLQFFALWMGLPEGGHVKVKGNFDIDFAPELTMPFLLSLNKARILSDQSLFEEVQRRGLLSDELDWDEEKAKVAAQPAKVAPPNTAQQ
ncbi:protein of unknown function [Pseudomonas saponiphila]|uniref:DUF4055 domain-containing protein n=1 Tax=Pseudomonas saponiphila TaxID=556534 RepID=A0A1H4R042_9PSED|nr:DUF4055 domain-containing protein [Pseudomonas saponiphila]SEC25216.1 protein of unknown function [Pseudomonas saponiphila]